MNPKTLRAPLAGSFTLILLAGCNASVSGSAGRSDGISRASHLQAHSLDGD